jgi:hypothetical protein
LESRIKLRRAPATRPLSLPLSRNSYAAARALIDVARRSPHSRQNCCSNLVERGPGKGRHAVRDAVVPVLRVPAEVAIEPVSHMQQLLSDYDFERPRSRLIDARQVDQNEMIARRRRKGVGTADRAPQPPAQPAFEDATLGSDAESVRWQHEERDVSFEQFARFHVVNQPSHNELHGDG